MAINFHPDAGTLLVCDFSGMVEPEMVKSRPIIVVSPRLRNRTGLCTIVPLSTTPPAHTMPWHSKLILDEPLSPKWKEVEMWTKCDMLYTMRFERLDRFHTRIGSHRKYYDRHLNKAQFQAVRDCIYSFLF